MTPPIECPYCGLDLLELPDHDLFRCHMQAAQRRDSQVAALERLHRLEDLRPKEKE